MPPTSSRDFLRAGAQRFTTAEFLLKHGFTLDAQYLAGYTIECCLKALILAKTAPVDQPAQLTRIRSGATMHRAEVLLQILRDLGVRLPLRLVKRFRRFDWTTDLRYEVGRRDTGETRAFLRAALEAYEWVKGES